MKVVTKIGGSLFKENLDPHDINRYGQVLKEIHRQGHQVVVITGGGRNARKYIEAARALGANEAQCDQIGIYVTRLNARLLIAALGDDAFPEVPETVEEFRRYSATGKITVMGGLQPAQSTDAVAAVIAEMISANLLVKTIDAPGICTEDPKKHPDAKKIDQINAQRLLEMLSQKPLAAGAYEMIDPVAVKVIERSKIPTRIVPGDDPRNIERALKEEPVGTKIIP